MRFSPVARTAAAALSALAVLLAPATVHAAAAKRAAAPGDSVTLPVRDALATLPVQGESRAGYERTKFKHWTDADRDGCNTRMEVLKAEAVTVPVQGSNCILTGGSWYSPYDDRHLDSASKLDVDHLVPLAEAWDSGASQWTAKERELYANDLDDARDLIAVSAASNRSKADKDPSEWLPPYAGHQCQYDTNWAADKTRWGLSIDATERDALTQQLTDCPAQPISVVLAR
ncbi:HNH endonuclease family protein [Streptomyces sp. NPDC013161]|uniref:HNH endonuclease family protein n=1 Tax=Streptomyces sp. NPDC013161 TaxID=3364862 RepID=UPI00369F2C9D